VGEVSGWHIWERVRTPPLPSKKAYEALRRRSRVSAMTPETTNASVAARVINSGVIGSPPVSDSAVAVGLAVAVAVPVAVDAGLAVAVEPVTVTLPIIPRDSCGMQK
jgi:hypothetical protein